MFDEREIKDAVRKRYGDHACKRMAPAQKGHILDMEGHITAGDVGYSSTDLAAIPEGSDLGLSCGNPLALVALEPGQTVLDLGSGGGLDCLIASEKVGPQGRVIGVDMTTEMIELARNNTKKKGCTNVEFKLGEIENLPVADASVDVVVSNCAINLVVNKERAFTEAFRVLRPGGSLAVSDIVTLPNKPARLNRSLKAYTACLAGAIPKEDYLALMEHAGFINIRIVGEQTWPFFRGYVSAKIISQRPSP